MKEILNKERNFLCILEVKIVQFCGIFLPEFFSKLTDNKSGKFVSKITYIKIPIAEWLLWLWHHFYNKDRIFL